MKNYLKGIITGIIIGAVICSIPALADTIDALFNNVRISVNGIDEIQWDENITLADGVETPASILYNGTTYLPMRKLGELSGNKIYWNGDSRTVGMTSQQKDIKVIAEKPDKNGNMWEYYTFNANTYQEGLQGYYDDAYLGVRDKERGYERVYNIAPSLGTGNNVRVTDDAIYFVKSKHINDYVSGKLTKLEFDNDSNSQDGETIDEDIMSGRTSCVWSASFEGDLVYFNTSAPHSNSDASTISVYDYINKRKASHTPNGSWPKAVNIRTVSTEDKIIFTYELITSGGFSQGDYEVTFDKNTFNFDKAQKVETTEIEETE